jgi:hypothetical protein
MLAVTCIRVVRGIAGVVEDPVSQPGYAFCLDLEALCSKLVYYYMDIAASVVQVGGAYRCSGACTSC